MHNTTNAIFPIFNLIRKWNITIHNWSCRHPVLAFQHGTPSALSPAPIFLSLPPQISFWLQSPDTGNFHSLYLSPVQRDEPHELKPRVSSLLPTELHFLSSHAAPLKPSLSHSTQLGSAKTGYILGMPRKLLIFPEAGAGEQGHDIPSVFLRALITMTDRRLPSPKGQESKTAKGRICNRDHQSCK